MSPRVPDGAEGVSEATARRLSVYLRDLQTLEAESVTKISSHDFAKRFRLNSAQIRKDLATFGDFGIRGVGYDVSVLKSHLVSLLGLDKPHLLAICGAGRLGLALARSAGFRSAGFSIGALFDVDPSKIGSVSDSGVPILSMDRLPSFVKAHPIDIGVLAVPADAAERTYRALTAAGVRAILNFAPARLPEEPGVFVKNVDLRIHLETLSFYLKNG
jgi:redox-sensing transcriptional repressor